MLIFIAKILFTITLAAIPVLIAAFGIRGYFRDRHLIGALPLMFSAAAVPWAAAVLVAIDLLWRL